VPILTKDPITKGSPATFTLDKAALALVASVANSTYYADTANWKSVVIIYKSDTGNQSKKVTFDVSGAGPYTAPFFASAQSKNVFNVYQILILDYDGGNFPVYSSELTVGEFDIDMGVISAFLNSFLGSGVTKQTYDNTSTNIGQLITIPNPANLTDISFRLSKVGNPTGQITAHVVNVSAAGIFWGGNYSNSPNPVVSSTNIVNVADIGVDQDVKFTLPAPYFMDYGMDSYSGFYQANTYWIYITISGGTLTANDRIELLGNDNLDVGINFGGGGNRIMVNGNPIAESNGDLDYKLYGTEVAKPVFSYTRDFSNPNSFVTTNGFETSNAVIVNNVLTFDQGTSGQVDYQAQFNTQNATLASGKVKFSINKNYKLRLHVASRTNPTVWQGGNLIYFSTNAVYNFTEGQLAAAVGSYIELTATGAQMILSALVYIRLYDGVTTFSHYEFVEVE
jgi:hypothetical protein